MKKIIDLTQSLFNINLKKNDDFYNKLIEIDRSLVNLPMNLDVFKTSFNNNLPYIRSGFLIELLKNKPLPGKENMEVFEYFKIKTDFPHDTFNIVLIESNSHNTDETSFENILVGRELIKYNMYELFSNVLAEITRFEMLDITTGRTAILINFDGNEAPRIINNVLDKFNLLGRSTNTVFSAAIGAPCSSIENIHICFEQAVQCFKYNFVHPEINCFNYNDIAVWEKNNSGYPGNLPEEIDKQLKMNNCKKVYELLETSKRSIKDNCLSYNYTQQIIIELANIISKYAREINCFTENDQHNIIIEEFGKLTNIDEFYAWLEDIASSVTEFVENKRNTRNQTIIDKVQDYITQNIHSDLSLNSIADAFYINPFNLSKMFKDEKGINLIDFIVDQRVQKAREMLVSTNISIDRIAEMCGYNATSYFIRKFKEKYYVTPKQYRHEHAGKCLN
jgi:AraC-like DNA-binding protein